MTNIPSQINIGRQCLEKRKQLGLTQQQAASRADVARRYISEIERDKFRGALWILERYLRILELKLTTCEYKRPTWDQLDSLFADET